MQKYINECQNCAQIQGCKFYDGGNLCKGYTPINELGPKPKKSKSMCGRCHDHYYEVNQAKGCWSYAGATVVAKCQPHSSSECPPWRAEWQLSCFHGGY